METGSVSSPGGCCPPLYGPVSWDLRMPLAHPLWKSRGARAQGQGPLSVTYTQALPPAIVWWDWKCYLLCLFSFINSELFPGASCTQGMNKMADRRAIIMYWLCGKTQSPYAEGKALCLPTTTGQTVPRAPPVQPHLHTPSSSSAPASPLQPLWKTLPFAKLTSSNQGPQVNVTSSMVPAELALSKVVRLFPTNQSRCST